MKLGSRCFSIRLCFAGIAGIFLLTQALKADTPRTIQTVPPNVIQSMDNVKPGVPHTWWAAVEADPIRETERILALPDSDIDVPGGAWMPVRVPATLIGQAGLPTDLKEAWVLKIVRLSETPKDHIALRLGEIMDRDIAYLNGVAVGRTGEWDSPRAQGYDRQRIYETPDALWRKGRNVIMVRVQGYFPKDLGLYRDTTAIGPSALIRAAQTRTDLISALFLMVYLSSGGYFLFLFIRRRSERENLFFGLFSLGLVIYQFFRTQIKYDLGIDFYYLKKAEYFVLFPLMPLFYYFIRYLLRLPRNRFTIWIDRVMYIPAAIAVGLIGYTLFTENAVQWNQASNWFMQRMQWPLCLITSIGIIAYRISKKDKDAVWIAVGLGFTVIGLVVDSGSNLGWFNFPRIMGYVFVGFVAMLALILANRFVRLNEEVEDLNHNLEQKVADRTEQLQRSLEEVHALKIQQDGDYFLTSLLVSPLGGNFTKSRTVSTEILTRQKKSFEFRKWQAEIGGDLCVAQSIRLRGRVYTVFLNGDAMGKSIQGAGGALVLGTVFKAILTRTEMNAAAAMRYPEQWLKDCFTELQNVFVSFDGYMMVSAVIGLIDDETGTMYFVNAEHPWLVLYRDEKASFIENELLLRKFGIAVLQTGIQIRTFQMKQGDVVFCGSDGRDDILLGVDSSGNRIINEDEFRFLRAVEEGRGILEDIERSLRSVGELTDDLSLIRISYREDFALESTDRPAGFAEAYERGRALAREGKNTEAMDAMEAAAALFADDPELMRDLGQTALQVRDYARAARYCERYTELVPQNTELLFATSYALKKNAGRSIAAMNRAADFGERCRLREPRHVRNLVNLADIYRILGNKTRARAMIDKVLQIEPENARALQLGQSISA